MPLRMIGFLALAGCLAPQAGAATYTLVTEPDQGMAPIYNLIGSAKRSVDMTMYELTDTQAEQLLAQAASNGVTVRVILDQNLEKSNNTAAFDYLNSHGVQARWANPAYSATHQKTITVDGATSAIMSLNLTSSYYATSRDFAVIENDPNDIAAIEATFDADFTAAAVTPADGDDLVWSPTNSEAVILGIINSAGQSLFVENEEMGDPDVTQALLRAAARGVLVRVVMTNTADTYAAQFNQLVAAGVKVSTYAAAASLYIHAKVVLADYGSAGARVFVGSENFSNASLNKNRELGLVLSAPAIVESIEGTLASDFQGAEPWLGQGGIVAVNAASFQAGVASAGWVTIFGTDLSPVTDDWTKAAVNGKLPTSLDGVTVTVGGIPAYPAYISPTQINAVAPNLTDGTVMLTVSGPNGTSAVTVAAYAFQPAFFQWGSYAVATHQDFTLALKSGTTLGTTVPAAPGEVIILWGAGFGPTDPAAPVGSVVPSGSTYYTTSSVSVTLGATPATVLGAALAPGLVGFYQVAIQVPSTLVDGDYPVRAVVSGIASPPDVLLTVRQPKVN